MSAFYKWAPSSFHKNNFFERQLHINLFYYYKYLISSKLYLIVLLQIVIKMENRLPRRLKIPDTCIVRYYHHFYTGQRAKIPDSPVKYRTPGNPNCVSRLKVNLTQLCLNRFQIPVESDWPGTPMRRRFLRT